MSLLRKTIFVSLTLIVAGLATATSAQADPVVIGNGTFQGTIIGTSVDQYSFVASAGDNVSFTGESALPPNVATDRGELRLRLFDINGMLLAEGSGPVTGFLFSFTHTGIYSLAVSSLSPFDPPFFNYTLTVSGLSAVPTPEPATLILLGTGLAGAAARARRRRGKRGNV